MTVPLILSFDTSAAHVAAALLCGDQLLAREVEEMSRGQAERLMPLIDEVLTAGGKQLPELNAIGVGVGPGNFTGIRISVSAARGLALGLGIPAVGVNSFDAMELDLLETSVAMVPGPRGQGYLRQSRQTPRLASAEELAELARDTTLTTPEADELVLQIARFASQHYLASSPPPAPLYVKPADAAAPKDPAPVILNSWET